MHDQLAPARRVPRELDLVAAAGARLDPPLAACLICVDGHCAIMARLGLIHLADQDARAHGAASFDGPD